MSVIKTSISLDETVHNLALKDSKLLLGRENLSAYISYLITKTHRKNEDRELKEM